ncbi:hypothetical protein [Aliivibrio fischeri]|uniref:Uncharacterized protein n=1 Tax=Aliivibrio fischeri TaxID=668 RepID=A0A510UN35_ALIFS|nr:hypothetical protein [Aliivibrio fischeri]MUK51105.1 hypothetical protein [Aliivibrio fischeri]GEK16058.1 hypothetical protein AFI02nite_40940 [Aliivibrio fischeri]
MPICSIAPSVERSSYLVKFALLMALFALLFIFTGHANAADIFAGAKSDITEATNTDSTLYLAITALSLIVAVITGVTTKNWFGAIGGFAASMIFISAGMKMVGLG